MPRAAVAAPSSSASSTPSGLMVPGRPEPLPLEHVHVDVSVVDLAARVTLKQRYRNTETVPLEVVYVFPLDEGAAVCGFCAHVDGVRFDGAVKERDEAFKDYDDAMEAGHGAFLLDEERADVLTVSLGNLNPGSAVDLEITYVTELAAEGRAVRFMLPTTVSPRYAPAEDQTGVGPTPADTLSPPVAFDVPYRFTFEMDLAMAGAIRAIESPSHPVAVELDGARARVRLSQRDAAMDADLVIVIAAESLDVPHATVERGEQGAAMMVSFVPTFTAAGATDGARGFAAPAGKADAARGAAAAAPADVVFVIDRSGSMGGDSIAEVRNALQLCLRSLSAGCTFNIVSFGNTYHTLFPDSRIYDDASLAEASAFVATVDADMGGTEILPALEHVVSQQLPEGMARQVVLLTDGEVTNTDAVIALAGRHTGATRFFTFGIGAGASQHLVRGIARASGGAAEFIAPGERIEPKVMRQFKRLLAPALLDARVTWPGRVTAAPERLPAVFDGERLIAYALADVSTAGTATLSGILAGRPVTYEVPIDASRAGEGTLVATLAARARIRDLEEAPAYLKARGSRQARARSNRKAADEIVALAVRYQLVSRETSFVAVEHREIPTDQPAELRRVPIALTRGWGASRQDAPVIQGLMASRVAMPPASPGVASAGWTGSLDIAFMRAGQPADRGYECGDIDACFEDNEMACVQSASLAQPDAPSAPRAHDRLVSLQRADGSWDLDEAFAEAVWLRLATLEEAMAGATGDDDTVRRALATAVAIVWLEIHALDAMIEWEMLADKGVRWLQSCGASPAGGGDWLEIGRAVVV